MEDVFLTLFRCLDTYIADNTNKQHVYEELIPLIYEHDDDLLMRLLGQSDEFDEAFHEFMHEHSVDEYE